MRERILMMASRAETAVSLAVKALMERDDALARKVEQDDAALDQDEVELDELCINLLALKAPLASDLRLITVAMKISQNLERVGDEGTKIARRALKLNGEPPLKPLIDLPRVATLAIEMLKTSLDAFVKGDVPAARTVIGRDAEVDALNKEAHESLARVMAETPETIGRCLHWMVISKSLERIADHATNIAEEAVFLLEGRDIRHTLKTPLPG